MTKFKHLVFILVALSFGASSSYASTSVWRISDGANEVFLGGTIHLLKANNYPLPSAYDVAFEQCDTVVLEVDVGAINTPDGQAKTIKAMTYSDGRTLSSVLSRGTYEKVKKYLADKSMPIEVFNNFSAGGMSLTLSVMEFQALGFTAPGVDAYYYANAQQKGKRLMFLETPEQQLSFIARLGEGTENESIEYTLRDIKRLPELSAKMVEAWQSGDMQGLDSLMIAEMKRDFPDVYKLMLLDRNQAWLPELEAMFTNKGVEFVLVGAAHLVGEDGLIALLKSKGYIVEQM